MMLMLLAMDAKLSDLDLQSFNRAAHEEKLKYANCHMPRPIPNHLIDMEEIVFFLVK